MIVNNNISVIKEDEGLDTGTYPRQLFYYYQNVELKQEADGKTWIYVGDIKFGELIGGGGGGSTLISGTAILIDSEDKVNALYDDSTIKVNPSNQLYIPIDNTTIKVSNGVLTAPLGLSIEVYNSLSDITNPNSKTIYLIPKTGTSGDVYNEYIYTNNQFEQIGTTQIDLSNYYTKGETDTLLSGKANASHTHVKTDITDFPTIPTVGNAKLTINLNNEKIGEFTANATSDKVVNISVPKVNNSTITVANENGTDVFGSFTTNDDNTKTINIPTFSSLTDGIVPKPTNVDISNKKYLSDSGTWDEIQGGGTEYAVYIENGTLQIPASSTTINITDETLNLI